MPRLRSWEAMDPRAAGVNDRLGAKDQLCAPQVFTFGHVRQLDMGIDNAQVWRVLYISGGTDSCDQIGVHGGLDACLEAGQSAPAQGTARSLSSLR